MSKTSNKYKCISLKRNMITSKWIFCRWESVLSAKHFLSRTLSTIKRDHTYQRKQQLVVLHGGKKVACPVPNWMEKLDWLKVQVIGQRDISRLYNLVQILPCSAILQGGSNMNYFFPSVCPGFTWIHTAGWLHIVRVTLDYLPRVGIEILKWLARTRDRIPMCI